MSRRVAYRISGSSDVLIAVGQALYLTVIHTVKTRGHNEWLEVNQGVTDCTVDHTDDWTRPKTGGSHLNGLNGNERKSIMFRMRFS